MAPIVKFKRCADVDQIDPPAYATAGAAGLDLPLCVTLDDFEGFDLRHRRRPYPFMLPPRAIGLMPGERLLCRTGFEVEIPPGYEGQVRPRSGLAVKHGITVLNTPGTIDCDYRGELRVLLVNLGTDPVTLRHGDRIAQLVIAPVARAKVELVEALGATERGAGGFGSTGT